MGTSSPVTPALFTSRTPDGTAVVYSTWNGLSRAPASGGPPTELVPNGVQTFKGLSPDGKWVVTSVTEPSYDEKKEISDLWIVPADGSAPPRRLTSSKAAESAPSAKRSRARFGTR